MVRLIEPDGTEGIVVDKRTAIEYCNNYPGWSWRELNENEIRDLT